MRMEGMEVDLHSCSTAAVHGDNSSYPRSALFIHEGATDTL
jgi:hypothetical protein